MTLRDTVASDMTASLKAGDKERLGALRLLTSAVKYKELDLKAAYRRRGTAWLRRSSVRGMIP